MPLARSKTNGLVALSGILTLAGCGTYGMKYNWRAAVTLPLSP